MMGVTMPMMRIGVMAISRTASERLKKPTICGVNSHPFAETDDPEDHRAQADACPTVFGGVIGFAGAEGLTDQGGGGGSERQACREGEL